MIQIPSIKIPSVRVGSIGPASNIGAGGATPAPPTPITYLTQWKMLGNSTVHTDEYLTQWKVEGNSVVDNNAILSCGDLGQDGYYHVKISNGVTIYDIPLTEPLRKVGDISDTIEFADGVATLTRNFASSIMSDIRWYNVYISSTDKYRYYSAGLKDKMKVFLNNQFAVMLCPIYDVHLASPIYNGVEIGIASNSNGIYLYDDNYDSVDDLTAFLAHINGVELIYELATPTTETIQVSPFPVSATDTYTSVNDTSYSAFEYKKNVEIWSCGEYNPIDSKYHILIQPLGGSIADIALDEPLRKVNNVADTIEFADGVATVTRNLKEVGMTTFSWRRANSGVSGTYRFMAEAEDAYSYAATEFLKTINTGGYKNARGNDSYYHSSEERIIGMYGVSGSSTYPSFVIYDPNYNQADDLSAFLTYLSDKRIIYRLATPITEVIQVPQIAEAESYSCVISQGAKAVSWSSFETE